MSEASIFPPPQRAVNGGGVTGLRTSWQGEGYVDPGVHLRRGKQWDGFCLMTLEEDGEALESLTKQKTIPFYFLSSDLSGCVCRGLSWPEKQREQTRKMLEVINTQLNDALISS